MIISGELEPDAAAIHRKLLRKLASSRGGINSARRLTKAQWKKRARKAGAEGLKVRWGKRGEL